MSLSTQHFPPEMRYPRWKVWEAKKLLGNSQRPLILTGAGISADSGVPTFRDSKDGIWNTMNWIRYSHALARKLEPGSVWEAHEALRALVDSCHPSAGHQAITKICRAKPMTRIFTQNVDGLHARSQTSACELHGSLHRFACKQCGRTVDAPRGQVVSYADTKCAACGGNMQHDTVLFGDDVRFTDELIAGLDACDLVMLVGTSGQVTDTRGIAEFMHERGTPVIEVNTAPLTRSSKFALYLHHRAEIILPDLL